jgi:hypothetical protein
MAARVQLKILPLPDGEWVAGRKRYGTAEQTKLAGFDYITQNPRAGNARD